MYFVYILHTISADVKSCDCFFDVKLFAKINQLNFKSSVLAIKQRAFFYYNANKKS